MVRSRLLTASFFLLGLVVGVAVVGAVSFVYLNYVSTDNEIAAQAETTSPQIVESNKTDSHSLTPSRQSTENTEVNFEELLSKSQFDRFKTLHGHLRHADIDTTLSFLERSKTIAPIDLRREVQEVAIRQLVQLDPIAALQQVKDTSKSVRTPLMTAVFDEWSGEDLKGALDHATSMDEEGKRNALKGILLSRFDLSDSLHFDLARQLGHEQVLIDGQVLELAGEPVEDPASAWTEFLANHGGDVASLSNAKLALLRHVLDSWINRGVDIDVSGAVSTALQSNSNESAVRLLFETLARHDPAVAFHAASSIEDIDVRTQMQRHIVAEWINTDPLAVLGGLGLIPSELHDWSKQEALVALSATAPAEAAKRLGIISSEDAKSEVARTIVSNWAELNPEAARGWVKSDPEIRDLRWVLMYRIVWEVSQVDPDKALKWALEEPVNEQLRGRGLEQTVIRSVALQGNYETAISMAKKARDIENQKWSYVEIGNVMAQRGKSDDSWSLHEEIPERFQSLYESQVPANWVWAEPDTALERLENLPLQVLKESVARNLFYHNQMTHIFSNEQMRKLKKYLPERYQVQIK